MPPRITISKENYLKAIAEAESEGETVKAVTLARWLHVSAPAVTMAIKRLRRDALIRVGAEHLLVRDPRPAGLGQGLDDRARVARVRDGGDACGPAVREPAARGP